MLPAASMLLDLYFNLYFINMVISYYDNFTPTHNMAAVSILIH